jgi:hypothetical protein
MHQEARPLVEQRLAAELIRQTWGGDRREDRRLDTEGGLARTGRTPPAGTFLLQLAVRVPHALLADKCRC